MNYNNIEGKSFIFFESYWLLVTGCGLLVRFLSLPKDAGCHSQSYALLRRLSVPPLLGGG